MSLAIVGVYFVALLLYATWFGIAMFMFIAPCYDKLAGPTFIEWFQKIDPYMKIRAPQLTVAQIVVTFLLLILLHDRSAAPEFQLTGVALVLTVVAMVVAVRGNVPLNCQMDQWSASSLPDHWEEIRDQWLLYHRLRGIAEVAGFVTLLVATLLYVSSEGFTV